MIKYSQTYNSSFIFLKLFYLKFSNLLASLTVFLLLSIGSGNSCIAQDNANAFERALYFKDNKGNNNLIYEQSNALIIGINNYAWTPLFDIDDEVELVSTSLKRHGFKIKKVINPNKKDLLSALDDFIKSHGKEQKSRLLIYYTGHGYYDQTDNSIISEKRYIVPAGAPNPKKNLNEFRKAAVNLDIFKIFYRMAQAKHILFIFNSCIESVPQVRIIPRGGEQTHVHSSLLERVAENSCNIISLGCWHRSINKNFYIDFVNALNGSADANDDQYIAGEELYEYLDNRIMLYSAANPKFGPSHLRRTEYCNGGDIIFKIKE